MDLSVILPSYHGAQEAVASAGTIASALGAHALMWEIVIVDDGGNDFPSSLLLPPHTRLLVHDKNRGKGAAVRTGLRASEGAVRIFTDVDVPYGVDAVLLAYAIMRSQNVHLVIGDRTLPLSRFDRPRSLPRRMLSRTAAILIGSVIAGGFADTQCGLKAIRGDVAELILPYLRVDRFAFDAELVHLCLKLGLDIRRIPVVQRENSATTVRPVRDSAIAVADLFGLMLRQRRWELLFANLALTLRLDPAMLLKDAQAALPLRTEVESSDEEHNH
jgi:dolichyl-phosphate beta-glucosyltransferase